MLRVLGAGQPDLLLHHLGREHEAGAEQRRVVMGAQEVLPVEPAPRCTAERLLHRVRPLLRA